MRYYDCSYLFLTRLLGAEGIKQTGCPRAFVCASDSKYIVITQILAWSMQMNCHVTCGLGVVFAKFTAVGNTSWKLQARCRHGV